MIKKCLWCGKEFQTNHPLVKYCSLECRWKHYYQLKQDKKKVIEKKCIVCWKIFNTKNKNKIVCSNQCRWKYNEYIWREKYKNTNLKIYWYENPSSSPLIRKKVEETNIKKFGTKMPSQNKQIKEKIKQTNLQKLWVEYPMQSKGVQEKAKKTYIKNFGVDHPLKAKVIRDKIEQTCLKKYNKRFASQTDDFKKRARKTYKQTCLKKYNKENFAQTDIFKQKYKQTCLKKYNQTTYLLYDGCPKPKVKSKINKKWGKRISDNTWLNVEFEFNWIQWYAYDIKVWKYLIEIDPTHTHNSTSWYQEKYPKPKLYHQQKSLAAEQAWYHCIHIFDWDNNEKVKNWLIWLLTKKKNLHNWKIMKVDWKEAEKFYDANHLQGRCSATVHYWIYVKWELINCMSFTCFKWEWTLVRFASKMWYRIYCWASRLFNTFLKEYDPDYVVSFSDITKHSGWLYDALWFKLDKINAPSYWWVKWKNVYWRRDCQKQNMYRIEWFDPNYKYLEHKDDPFWKQTERQLMESHWYVRVYDAWMRKHIWRK